MPETEFDDQSTFSQITEAESAPPETILSPVEQAKADAVSKKRKKIAAMMIIGLGLFLGLMIVMAKVLKPVPVVEVRPTPTPMPVKRFTSTETELSRLEGIVQLVDPSEDVLPPPPIMDKLSF